MRQGRRGQMLLGPYWDMQVAPLLRQSSDTPQQQRLCSDVRMDFNLCTTRCVSTNRAGLFSLFSPFLRASHGHTWTSEVLAQIILVSFTLNKMPIITMIRKSSPCFSLLIAAKCCRSGQREREQAILLTACAIAIIVNPKSAVSKKQIPRSPWLDFPECLTWKKRLRHVLENYYNGQRQYTSNSSFSKCLSTRQWNPEFYWGLSICRAGFVNAQWLLLKSISLFHGSVFVFFPNVLQNIQLEIFPPDEFNFDWRIFSKSGFPCPILLRDGDTFPTYGSGGLLLVLWNSVLTLHLSLSNEVDSVFSSVLCVYGWTIKQLWAGHQ